MRYACLSAALLGALAASTPAAPAPEQKLEGKEVLRFEMPDVNVPRAMSISPNGRYAVAGSHRGKVYLWQLLK
jgi:hypothetical protein